MLRYLINLIFGTNFNGIIGLPNKKDKTQPRTNMETQNSRQYCSSEKALELIKKYETPDLTAVKHGNQWIIGYGNTLDVVEGMIISQKEADELLIEYLKIQDLILNKLLNNTKLSKNQYDVLSSFVHSIGITEFVSSDVLKDIKKSNSYAAGNELIYQDATGKYHGWIFKNGERNETLITRRLEEKKLFLKQD